jgi:hypothetical protein
VIGDTGVKTVSQENEIPISLFESQKCEEVRVISGVSEIRGDPEILCAVVPPCGTKRLRGSREAVPGSKNCVSILEMPLITAVPGGATMSRISLHEGLI